MEISIVHPKKYVDPNKMWLQSQKQMGESGFVWTPHHWRGDWVIWALPLKVGKDTINLVGCSWLGCKAHILPLTVLKGSKGAPANHELSN
jgi:hypothetical protein